MERYGIKMIFQFLIENESRILYEESIRLFQLRMFLQPSTEETTEETTAL